eukprot:CAMPEP_0182827136 /NCGR_PEP_ID=MMETSP0006_2-20121128/16758_1 /TAXON_ID=97485 /ORGANISM="Prymnesium parvum, Strain Texoma1" /LENGTH=577 /DNA_ID=CAMNT_0024954371 /DNA_START=11 /DNA_END=1744 /DNA_ORIENTATION=-
MSPAISLALYGRGWALHQLVPFVDKLLGLSGAMDSRMLGYNDFWLRLPIMLLALIFPTTKVLLIAHAINVASWAYWMPAVWDYMCWCAILELAFIAAALFGGGDTVVANRAISCLRPMLLILYVSAAFWKLTTGWFDSYVSCATVLMAELVSSPLFPPGAAMDDFLATMLLAAPALVAALEFAVPLGLWLSPHWGILLALVFHQTINLMPMTYAGGFSIAMCCRLIIYLPPSRIEAARKTSFSVALVCAAIVGMNLTLMWTVHGFIDTPGALFVLLTGLYGLAILNNPEPSKASTTAASAGVTLRGLTCGMAFFYAFLNPVLGIQSMGSSTMYGNVMQYGVGNHWILPTFLLQRHYAARSPAELASLDANASLAEWLDANMVDAFGGGIVRVESTTSKLMRQLAPAEATAQLPARAQRLLKEVGAGGHYFEMYAARNYFDRPLFNLTTSALHVENKQSSPPPGTPTLKYVQPVYEMRRVLALARERQEEFELTYTKIPTSLQTIREWRRFEGTQVTYRETAGGSFKCIVREQGSEKPCASDEIALLPPPPAWLQHILLPYPIPLVATDDVDNLYCST